MQPDLPYGDERPAGCLCEACGRPLIFIAPRGRVVPRPVCPCCRLSSTEEALHAASTAAFELQRALAAGDRTARNRSGGKLEQRLRAAEKHVRTVQSLLEDHA